MADPGSPSALHVSKNIKPKKLDAWMQLVDAVLEDGERAYAMFPSTSYYLLVITTSRLFTLQWAHRKSPMKAVNKAVGLREITAVRVKFGKVTMVPSIEVELTGGAQETYGHIQPSDLDDLLGCIKLATGEMNHSPIIDDSEILARAEAQAKKDAFRADAEGDKAKRDVRRAEERDAKLHEKMVAMGLLRKPDGTFEERPLPAEPGTLASLKKGWGTVRESTHGTLNSALICPHCQMKGQVRTQKVESKTGAGGVFAAVFTAGVSLLVSPRDTLAWCGNCKTEWRITK